MAGKLKSGVTQINVELEPAVLDRLKQFAEERGQTLKYVVGRAIVRHLDSPPPIAAEPPLAPCEPDPVKPAAKTRPKKK